MTLASLHAHPLAEPPPPASERLTDRSGSLHGRLDAAIRRVMRPGVLTIAASASLRQVERAMLSHRVHAIVVVGDEDGRPLGWVTSRGVLRRLGENAFDIDAGAAVDTRAVTIRADAPALEGVGLLLESGADHLLVVQVPGALPIGVVTALDLVRLGLAEPQV